LMRIALSLDSKFLTYWLYLSYLFYFNLIVSVTSIYQTQLPQTNFFVEELPLFAIIG
jgi:hypothetical protein